MSNVIERLFFRAAVLYALIGISIGIAMSASHNHAVAPAHAHLLLLGWLSMFAYGAFYKLHPTAKGTVAAWQFAVANLGVLVMIPGVALLLSGTPQGQPLAAIGALIVLLGMILFAVQVFRGTRA